MEVARVNHVYVALRLCYGILAVAAGADKFLHLLTDWTKYLPSFVPDITGLEPGTFMMIVGVVEIIAGIIVLSGLVRLGATIIALWLLLVAVNVAIAGFLDIAVRDIVIAIGAFSLATLAAARHEAFIPASSRPSPA